MSPFTYRDLIAALPETALDQPVRVFMRDLGTWADIQQAASVTELDAQGDLSSELPDDAWVLSTR